MGGVGSGKSRTALVYYFVKECKGQLPINKDGDISEMKKPKDLYIITTARKRDTLEWEKECLPLGLTKEESISGVNMYIDSWNNIKKYINVENAFFIFDEQKVVGSGVWAKSFIKITKKNNWILLTATPGDTWSDYIPVFIANGFYKNRTEFMRRHAVFNRYSKYPKIDSWLETGRLLRLRRDILVIMSYDRKTISHKENVFVPYDIYTYKQINKNRWNPYEDKPIKNASELCYLLRKVINSDESRIQSVINLQKKHNRLIIFYNFDYELEALRELHNILGIPVAEWNGHKHEQIPDTDQWLYLVQYTSGAEGWNCIKTDTIVFFSQNYSYKIMVQSAGRIDRLNTPYTDLYYYYIRSKAPIDIAITRAINRKKNFNEKSFVNIGK